MALHLYNTLTQRVEPFEPIRPGHATLYTCGPTIWNYAHIGNFRTFLFEDLLRRWLIASGFKVFQVMNLTDVDDRIIREASAKGVAIGDFTAPYAEAFQQDRKWLRIQDAEEYPRATGFIAPMIELVQGLLAKGVAYKGEDGSVYFAIARYPAYGKLSQLDKRQLKTGASGRVSSDEYDKENAQDFVLWKAAKPEDEAVAAAWDAPFGRGRPGWHLECSAMALALLKQHGAGDVLDIHAGGVDLIFPHHEDEIAQSCAFTGQTYFARYWLHGEFLNIRGTKMSKRFGNITTPRDLREDGVDPGAVRLLVFQAHYRQKMDLTDESLAMARESARRLGEFDGRLRATRKTGAANGAGRADGLDSWREWATLLERRVTEAMDDDLNAPRAIAALFDASREGNRLLDQRQTPDLAAMAAWDRIIGVFDPLPDVATAVRIEAVEARDGGETAGSLPADPPVDAEQAAEWARSWASVRLAAKKQKNFAEADRIRAMLKQHGFEIRDAKDGSIEVRRV
jgi:cysteinyl-tRNA synthetase